MLLRQLFIVLLITGLSSHAYAAKVYKWIDENGKTQYTQTPPPKSANSSSEVDVGRSANTLRPRKEGRHYYCGDHKLYKTDGKPARVISRLQESIIRWERDKERQYESRLSVTRNMNENIDRRNKYNSRSSSSYLKNYNKRLRNYDRNIAQIDCKIKWARGKLDGFADEKKDIAAKYESVNGTLEELKERKIATCGEDNREGVIVVDDQYRAYKRCIAPFDREIRRLSRTLRNAKRDYESVH